MAHDPLIRVMPSPHEHGQFTGRRSIVLAPETIAGFDAAPTTIGSTTMPLVGTARLLVDTRNTIQALATARDRVASPAIACSSVVMREAPYRETC